MPTVDDILGPASKAEEGNGSEGSFFTPEQVLARNASFTRAGARTEFNTPLTPDEEQKFRAWVSANKVPFNPDDKTADYDMRGFWQALQAGDSRAKQAVDPNDGKMHFPDYWKTPYDLTFSRQSKFANENAPEWNDKDQLVAPNGQIMFDDRNQAPYLGTPPSKPSLPNVDDVLGPEPQAEPHPQIGDYYFSPEAALLKTGFNAPKILSAFGQGAESGWGSEPLGLSQETQDWLKKIGVFNDYRNGQSSIVKSFNEAVMRPAAVAADVLFNRLPTAIFRGGQEAVMERARETGNPNVQRLARDIVSVPEAFMGTPHPIGMPAIEEARDLGVIGKGEEGWKGTAPEPQAEAVAKEAQTVQRQAVEQATEAEPEPVTPTAEPPVPPAPSIDQVVRQNEPDLFHQFDTLAQEKATYMRWLGDLKETQREQAEAQAPHADEIADLQARLADENTTPRLAKKYQARLAEMLPEHDAFIENIVSRDSPDMARVRQSLMQADFRMRDLAPDVTAAYQRARAQIGPEPEVASATSEAQPAVAPEPVQSEETVAPSPPEAQVSVATPAQPVAPPPDIASDVAQKLVSAGRPQEEADAAGALLAAHYQARAARFNGAKGTPEQLYASDGPAIRTGGAVEREPTMEFAQSARGKIAFRDAQATITLLKNADASTFIHETGHQWLEELMRDARDPQAPADLAGDVGTVRDWLGAQEGEAITRRQHEKFARGFERYMMEGRAPTVALAQVFEKFKQWLTAIYQTVAKLRSPISDDIRRVFDRMLAEPEKPVTIGREETAPETLADIHEAVAETTQPEAASDVADRIAAESGDLAKATIPEIHDEVSRGVETEAGPGAIQDSSSGGYRPPGQSEPGAEEARPAVREVREGRGETTTPSARPRTEQPSSPNQLFGPAETGLIDKAGNIRLDLLNAPEDVKEVIREAAAQNEGFIDARRGVISDAQVLDLADALGMDAAELSKRKLGQAFNAEQIMAARKLLIQSATNVRDLMAKAAEGADADLAAYAEAKARHLMIQEQVSGITAEAGRALRAFRNMGGSSGIKELSEFLQSATGKTPEQLRMEVVMGKKLLTPQQVSKYVRDSEKPGFGDMVLEYWINALISGPATHTTYSIGNALLSLWKAGPETGAAAAIGALRRVLGDEGPRVFAGEVPAQLYGMMHGLPNGIVAAWESLKSGRTILLPGEEAAMTARDLAMSPLVNPKAAIPDFKVAGIPVPLGTFIRLPSRAIAVIHSFFRTMNYEREIAGLAYRQAAEEGLAGEGLAGKINAAASRIGEITQDPSPDLMKQARQSATDLTLMGRGGELTQAISRLTNAKFLGFRWLKFVDPFVHISSNVIEQAILRRTPIGILAPEIRADVMGHNGPVARDMAIARMAVGSALAVGIGSLAAKGLVNGPGPSDPKEARLYMMVNGPPDSVRVGDVWYTTQRLGVLGMQVSIAADLYEMAHQIGNEDALTIAHNLVHAFTQNILDESFMRGPADLIRALTDPDRYGRNYVKNFLASFVPFSVGMGQEARAIDPYSRNARTLTEAVKNKIPWLSTTLLPRRDIWGEPIPNKDALGMAGLTSIYETRVDNDPVNKELLSLGIFPAMPERRIRGVELTDQQYDDYVRIAGRMAKLRLNQMVTMPGFDTIPPEKRHEMVVETIRHSREAARSLMMMQNLSIPQQAAAAKKAKLGAQ